MEVSVRFWVGLQNKSKYDNKKRGNLIDPLYEKEACQCCWINVNQITRVYKSEGAVIIKVSDCIRTFEYRDSVDDALEEFLKIIEL